MKSQNLWDFVLNKEKKKQKAFAMCVAVSNPLFAPVLFIA
jgi:hypothetical protein